MNRPLAEATSCRHLAVGTDAGSPGHFYPRCALGTRAERLAWLARIGPERLELTRALQSELDGFTAPYRRRLAEARGRQHAASLNGRVAERPDALLREFVDAAERFVAERGERFEAAGLRAQPLLDLLRELWTAWATSQEGAPPEGEALDALESAPAMRRETLLAPPAARPPILVHAGAGLEILYLPGVPGLSVSGDVDVANVEALRTALAAHVDGAPEFHVDLAGVRFCDLAGMGELVRAARRLDRGRRLVVHSLPQHLRNAMELVGWDRGAVPALVISGGAG